MFFKKYTTVILFIFFSGLTFSQNSVILLGSAEDPANMEYGWRAEETGGRVKVDITSLFDLDQNFPITYAWYVDDVLINGASQQELVTSNYDVINSQSNIHVVVDYTNTNGENIQLESPEFNYNHWRIRSGAENETIVGDNPTPFWETFSFNNNSSNQDENGDLFTDSDIHSIEPVLGNSLGIQPIDGEYIIRLHADSSNYGSSEPQSYSKRSELGNRDWNTRIRQDSEVFYSTYFYLPSEYWDNVTQYSIIFMQQKQYIGGEPNFAVRISNNGDYKMYVQSKFHLPLDQHNAYEIANLNPNSWHKLNVHLKPAFNEEGFMNIYLDGQLIYEYSGTNLRNQSSYDPDKHDTFIKLGMYTEIRDERVIYFDNIEMSNHIDSDISNWIQTPSSGITPITDSNFETAINTCLTTNPIDGMCTTSQYGAMPNWDVSNVTNMRNAFKDKVNFNADISSWNVSSVTDMYSIFGDAAAFNQDISSWDVNNVTDMGYMFSRATIFNQDISSWDVSGVTNMKYMFRDASNFNQDIGSWDVSDVNSMTYMFKSATTFNQNISGWCVSNITNEPVSFSIGSSLLESNKPIWGTCPDSSLSVEDNLKSILKIYPNPTKNSWKISTLKIIKSIELYDIVGRKVFWIVNPKSKDFELNGTSLSKGFYILVLNGKRKFRLIKN